MALSKGKLAVLKRQVAKLAANAPRPGQGAGWLAVWKLDDLTRMVEESVPREKYAYCQTCVSAVAVAFVARKEAGLVGMADAPELVDALTALDEVMGRCQNPPRGTDWRGRQELQAAVREIACQRIANWVIDVVWRTLRDDSTYPAGGRQRLEKLPDAWFTDTPPTADGEIDNEPE